MAIANLHIATAATADSCKGDVMTVDIEMPNVFDAGLPALVIDVTETPREVYPRIRAAQQLAPIAIGPLGPEVLSYELARAVLRDNRFVIPPGLSHGSGYYVGSAVGPSRRQHHVRRRR